MSTAAATVGAFELSHWLGAGQDGVRYAAFDPGGRDVEVRHLEPAVLAAQARRIALLRRIDHQGVLRVLDAGDPPAHVVLERGHTSWEDPSAWPGPDEILSAIRGLLYGLASAHALGIVHGSLAPGDVWRTASGHALDLSGLRTMPSQGPIAVAPELGGGAVASPAADVWSLGSILWPIAERAGANERVRGVIQKMIALDPEARPWARTCGELLETTIVREVKIDPSASANDEPPRVLGAYELVEEIGSGGMGRVYRARDLGNGHFVALKIMSRVWGQDRDAVARFRREARILSQLHSPFIARFVEANEIDQHHYLAMELVEGRSAGWILRQRGPMSVPAASSVARCIAHALSEVHALGLVHRDVKPGNILIAADSELDQPRAKLCDFGIARSTNGTDERVTVGATLGTPSYMAPEQISGTGELDARIDVYALAITLYELLTGQPPFLGDMPAVLLAHVNQPPPDVRAQRPDVPAELAEILERGLKKDRNERFDDAGHFLQALDAWRYGAAIELGALPQPIDLEGTPIVYDSAWDLSSTPSELWPYVSNTERLNRAIGLDDVEWIHTPNEDGVAREGTFKAVGMTLRWKENPFEWIAPHRLGVVREYSKGPLVWMRSTVELVPRESGTHLSHKVEIKPRNLLGRAAASFEIGIRLRRALERVYRRIDDSCRSARDGRVSGDPFEEAPSRSLETARKLDAALSRLTAQGVDPYVLEALRRFLESAPAPRLARIRPRPWAREHGFDEDVVIAALLRAAAEGILIVLWDILCPTCRIASSMSESLRALAEHGRCDACNLDFELDLARSVELVFRVDPDIRAADGGMYCIGGPAHSPHVLAQVRLAPDQRVALDLALPEGSYRIASRALDVEWRFSVSEKALLKSWDISLLTGLAVDIARCMSAGRQRIILTNDLGREAVVRVESTASAWDAFTAADAAANGLFRALFPEELLPADKLVGVSRVAVLFCDAGGIVDGDHRDEREVYRGLCELLASARDAAEHEGGALVKLQGDAVMSVFTEPSAAMRAALTLMAVPGLRAAVHAGPAMMATIQNRLDYFGRTVQHAAAMLAHATLGDIVVSDDVACDPGAEELLRTQTSAVGVLRLGNTVAARVRIA